jgi:hypothetical protein
MNGLTDFCFQSALVEFRVEKKKKCTAISFLGDSLLGVSNWRAILSWWKRQAASTCCLK